MSSSGRRSPSFVLDARDYGLRANGVDNDTAALDAALAALPAGGTLQLPAGRIMTDGGHVLNSASSTLLGPSGRAQTYNSSAQLYLRGGANRDMLTIASNQTAVRNLSLYGNYTNQTSTSHGIVTPTSAGANYLILDSVWVDSVNGKGMYFQSAGSTLSMLITQSWVRKAQDYGIHVSGTATDSQFSDTVIDQCVQSGVYCSAGDMSFTQVHIWGCGTGTTGFRDGITFQSSSGCRVINSYIETQTEGAGIRFANGTNKGHILQGNDIWSNGFQGIYGFQASNTIISDNQVRQNNYKGQTLGGGSGIFLDTCTAMSVTGNSMYDAGGTKRQTYGYYENGTANAGNVFLGNVSRAADHLTGNWVIPTGTASPTLPASPELYNAG